MIRVINIILDVENEMFLSSPSISTCKFREKKSNCQKIFFFFRNFAENSRFFDKNEDMIYINDHLFDFDLDAALAQLSEQRREQALRYRHELGRRTCAAAYLLLCEGLKKEYGITEKPILEYGEHGKPSIVGRPDIHFSLSHCREAAICVLSDRPVGVDVETIHRYSESLVRYTMNDEEIAQILASARPDLAFTRLWTQKEAVVKCTGEGISNDLKNVLSNFLADKKLPSPSGEGQGERLLTVESPDGRYVYSICNG